MKSIGKRAARATAAAAVAILGLTGLTSVTSAQAEVPRGDVARQTIQPAIVLDDPAAPGATAGTKLGDQTLSYAGKVQVLTSSADALPDGMKAAITRDLKISPDEYLKQSALSAAASRVVKHLAAEFPGQITGGWADKGNIVIAATTDKAQTAAKDLGLAAIQSKHSADQLEAMAAKLMNHPGLVSVAIDAKKGGLTVSLAPGANLPAGVVPAGLPVEVTSNAQHFNYADVAPDWSGSPSIRNGRGIYLANIVDGLDTNTDTWRPQAKRPTSGATQAEINTWNAAVRDYNTNVQPLVNQVYGSLGACSIGFGMKGDGTVNNDTRNYISTSGHCFAHAEGKQNVWVDNDSDTASLRVRDFRNPDQDADGNGVPGSMGAYVGTSFLYQMGGTNLANGDPAAGNAKTGNWPGAPNIDAALIPVSAGLEPSNQVWTYPTVKPDNPAENVAVTSVGDPAVGDNVCHAGVTSGWHCGPVLSTNVSSRTGGESGIIRGFNVDMCGSAGDSGGATVMGTVATGLLQGGNQQAPLPAGEVDCDPNLTVRAFISDMTRIKPALDTQGVRILQDVAAPVFTAPTEAQVLPASTTKTTITGTAVAGDPVEVTLDGVVIGTATADPVTGVWRIADVAVAGGPHVVKAQSKRDPVNFSNAVTRNFSVSTELAPPVITAPTANQVLPVGTVTSVFRGTAAAGDKVEVSLDGVVRGVVTADASGVWSLPNQVVTPGAHEVSARSTRDSVVFSTEVKQAFSVDIPATAPTITAPTPGAVLPYPTATTKFTGTGKAGETIVVTLDGVEIGQAVVAANGTWTSADVPVTSGSHTVSVLARRSATNQSPAVSSSFTVEARETAPVITKPTNNQGFPLGTTKVELAGTATAGAIVKVKLNGVAVGTVTAIGGVWSIPDVTVGPGTFTVAATAQRSDTNVSVVTSSRFTVESPAGAPVILSPQRGAVLPVGTTSTDIKGTAPANAKVIVKVDNGAPVTVTSSALGAWTVPGVPVTVGEHMITAFTSISPTNESDPVTSTFSVEARAQTPLIVTPSANQKFPVGTSKVTITGTATPGDTAVVSLNGRIVARVPVSADRTWTATELAVTPGTTTISVIAERSPTNQSLPTTRLFSVESPAPAPVIMSPTEGALLPFGTATTDISGTVTPGDVVLVKVGSAAPVTVTADANGKWILKGATVVAGVNTVTAQAKRGDSNLSPVVSRTFRIDGKAIAPAIKAPATDQVFPGQSTAISVIGTGTAGDLITVRNGTATVGTATVAASGWWQIAGVPVASGTSYTFTAEASRGSNVSERTSVKFSVSARATAPLIKTPAPRASLPWSTTSVTISGTATAGDTVLVTVNGTSVGEAVVAANGTWSIPGVKVTNSFYRVTAVARRGAANFSAESVAVFSVQKRAATPVVTSPLKNAVLASNTAKIALAGKATVGDSVAISLNGKLLGTVKVAANGTWAIYANVSPGSFTVSAVATSAPGNQSLPGVSQFSVAKPVSLVVYQTPTSDNLYKLTGSGASTRAVHISYAEWQAAGFPTPRKFPSAYVKYTWSDDIYAVNFWNPAPATWTWHKLTYAEWLRGGSPKPSVAGWIIGTQLHQYSTSDEIFAVLNGKVHKLTYAEWQAMEFRSYTIRANQGFAKAPTGDTVYRMTSVSGLRGVPVTFAQWAAEDFPTPARVAKAPQP